ncbi:MAG: hypothetical protein IJ955_03730, partial [Oscillospiraceae bacterium]|nr:hypothetical protein [Oscillospiraceae bacterium]
MGNSIYDSEVIFKYISSLKLDQHFRRIVLQHITTILISVFMYGYNGKTVEMSRVSARSRTTIA